MKHEDSFESRMLYDQTCRTEEGYNVYTAVYAVLWMYPGAVTKTTARIRISSVFTYEEGEVTVVAATIEKWRNEGWSMLDDYHDTRQIFMTITELRDRLINQAKSFLMGIPLGKIDSSYSPEDPQPDSMVNPIPKPAGKPSFKVLQYTKDKGTTQDIISKDKEDSPKKDDDDDFDFI